MKTHQALLAVFAAVALTLPARPDPLPGAAAKTVQVSLVALGRLPRYVQLQNGIKTTPVELTTGSRSGPYVYSGTPPLVLFTERKDAQGKPVRTVLATVAYPADWARVVILLSSAGAGTGEPLRGLAINDSPEAFPAGQMKLFNFYPSVLAATNGAAPPVQILSGQSGLVPLVADAGGRTWIHMAVFHDSRWKALPPFVTGAQPGMRVLALAYEQNGKPSRTLIFDTLPLTPQPGMTLTEADVR